MGWGWVRGQLWDVLLFTWLGEGDGWGLGRGWSCWDGLSGHVPAKHLEWLSPCYLLALSLLLGTAKIHRNAFSSTSSFFFSLRGLQTATSWISLGLRSSEITPGRAVLGEGCRWG